MTDHDHSAVAFKNGKFVIRKAAARKAAKAHLREVESTRKSEQIAAGYERLIHTLKAIHESGSQKDRELVDLAFSIFKHSADASYIGMISIALCFALQMFAEAEGHDASQLLRQYRRECDKAWDAL
jgi:hypothetical protein